MSQEYTKREPSRFQPELDANRLVSYTTHILVNRKYFPDEVQQTIVPKVVDNVMTVAELVNEANSINVREGDIFNGYRHRILLQREALKQLNKLKQRIKIFKLGYNLAGHKANAWNREVNKAINSLVAWHNSEIRKVKDMGGSL